MLVFTDSIDFAEHIIGGEQRWFPATPAEFDRSSALLAGRLVSGNMLYFTYTDFPGDWNYLFIVEYAEESQYDAVISLAQYFSSLPESLLCIAGRGNRFHGFKNRTWSSLMGNIHLSALFKPNRKIEQYGTGFMIISVLSAIEAVESLPELEGLCRIKWVNDVYIEKSKICGALAHAQLQGNIVTTAEIGIGLNVERKPNILPDKFIPGAVCMRDYAPYASMPDTLAKLSFALCNNYNKLISDGYQSLLKQYIRRSMCIGKNAHIFPDDGTEALEPIKSGKIKKIGSGLELYFEGDSKPVTSGRLLIE